LFKIITRLMPLLLFALIQPIAASAQQPDHPPGLNLGDAVVSGFSGTLPPDPNKPPPRGKSAVDLTFINPDGPSLRVIDVSRPGYVWDGRLLAAPKTFDVLARDIGQVFGVALDDANPPNIYAAATSAFGLNIVRRGRDGQPERRKKGGPGAGWMQGQFGLDLQGGPGAIYKIDGRTGVTTLFANITLDGVPNPAPGLGNLAYDAAHKQLFVSDLYTGMIHRFDLDGRELSRYDHGVTGLTAAKLKPVAFDPKNRPNIASERFDSEKPATWGFAPAARRVWGLAVHQDRLYYAVAAGPQIWSVGIARDGSFADDPRWEFDVPAQAGPLPVSDIAFSQQGAMLLAQRAPIAASYDYSAFTQPAEPQVLRVWLKGPNDPPSPGRWKLTPEEYAIGFAGQYRNSNGGVALGYGYGRDGTIAPQSCGAALWSSGQNLRNNPALRSQLEPGGPLVVHGLQGSPADLVRNANTPPATSYFVDYDDTFDDPAASGHIGGVRIYATPCAGAAQIAPVAAMTPVPATPPIGCVGPNCGHACTPTCVCPPGTQLVRGECLKIHDCPDGQVFNPAIDACACPPHSRWIDGHCRPEILNTAPQACNPPMIQIPGGPCVCPQGTVLVDGQCVPQTTRCQPPMVPGEAPGTCVCPQGSVLQDGKCVPQVCKPPLVPGPCVDGKPIDLGVVKTGGTTPAQVPVFFFQIVVTNHGDAFPGAGVITVTDTVPPNTTFSSVSGTDWNCVPSSGGPGTAIKCTYTGTGVTAGQVLPAINIDATESGNAPYPPITNCAVVSTPSGSGYVDDDPANDKWCVTVSKSGETGTLSVTKKVSPDPRGIGGTLIFPMTVTCTNPAASYPLNVHGNTSTVPFNVPVGSQCSVTETLPALPKGCTWLTPIFSPANVTIASGLNQEMVTNGYRCREVPCPPPQVMNEDGICVCPPPMLPGAILGQCICPQGTTLVNGKCVPAEVCPPPLVMIPGVGCRCPRGEVLVGKECVKPIVCRPPLVPNATNTDCVCPAGEVLRRGKCVEVEKPKRQIKCPRGTIRKGNTCVEEERHKPHVNTDDVIRVLPGFLGGHGGGSRDGGGGGGGGGAGGGGVKGKP
jgi:hypothetical protein